MLQEERFWRRGAFSETAFSPPNFSEGWLLPQRIWASLLLWAVLRQNWSKLRNCFMLWSEHLLYITEEELRLIHPTCRVSQAGVTHSPLTISFGRGMQQIYQDFCMAELLFAVGRNSLKCTQLVKEQYCWEHRGHSLGSARISITHVLIWPLSVWDWLYSLTSY